MPGNAFIRFTTNDKKNVPGEAQQETHPASAGWLEISDWSWDIEADTNFLKGTGASVGVAVPGTLSFTHTFDKSSPVIMNNIVLGTSFLGLVIHMLKSTGNASGNPEVYFALKAANVFITKVSSKAGEDGTISQDVECVFKAVSMGYKVQKQDGSLDSAAKMFGWNIAEKSMSPGISATLDPKSE